MTPTPPPTAGAASAARTPAIEIHGLTRTFGRGDNRVTAVDGIDLEIGRGEIVALLGPNGAGKTTALDILLGLSDPDSGTVRVLGSSPEQATAAGSIAAVLQTGGLLADLTVRETVRAIAGLYGKLGDVDDVLELTDLKRIEKRRVNKCSGGEQQRVKFALALLPDPDVLVLDEPTAGMDVNARRHFWEVMRQDAMQGRTILFATHYLEEAEQFAQRTVVMNHGKIIADAPTASLRASLGGRTVMATLPAASTELVAGLQADPGISDIVVDAGRISARSEASDALALRLLQAGATELEITAPTLETAFTSLTEDAS